MPSWSSSTSGAWFPKIARKDYSVGLNLTGNGIDDPDQNFYENYACGSERNYTHYCNKDLEKLFDAQSAETDVDKRQKLVWEHRQEAAGGRGAADHLFHARTGTCWKPYVKNMTIMTTASTMATASRTSGWINEPGKGTLADRGRLSAPFLADDGRSCWGPI